MMVNLTLPLVMHTQVGKKLLEIMISYLMFITNVMDYFMKLCQYIQNILLNKKKTKNIVQIQKEPTQTSFQVINGTIKPKLISILVVQTQIRQFTQNVIVLVMKFLFKSIKPIA